MELQQETNRQLILQRLSAFRYPVWILFLVLIARLWQLQILQGGEYAVKAENNRIRAVELTAPRGAIKDRNGVQLAENRPSFTVLLYRESIKDNDDTVRFLVANLGLNSEDLYSELSRSSKSGLFRPITVKEDAGLEDISIIEAHRRDHPEIQLVPEQRRLYPNGKLASHVLGYIGEITEEELNQDLFPKAESGSLVGKSGIERSYNEKLAGKNGERLVLVDSRGREVKPLEERSAAIGEGVQLTLDARIQEVAEEALLGQVGAIVAMDPRSGEILAMASAPSFDPNAFSRRLSRKDWQMLLEDPDHPMQNRCIQNSYAPGSIFKLIMAEAGLSEGLVDDTTSVFCTGSEVYYGRTFRCGARDGHGRVGLEEAIAHSCNIFFYELGRKLGISRISKQAILFGLNEKTGIDLPGERSGTVPNEEWKRRTTGEPWYSGETIPVSIGQGALTTTPLQILRAVSALANGGYLVTPHVLLKAEAGDRLEPWPRPRILLDPGDIEKIKEGMWRGVNDGGTGHNAAIAGRDISGKTGTAQVMSKESEKMFPGASRDHAWFAGFGGRDDPEIAVVVFLENGGKGGVVAAPLARKVFEAFYRDRE